MAGSSTPSRPSPRTASSWPSCPRGSSTRSTTRTSSTCPSRTARGPTWCRWPPPRLAVRPAARRAAARRRAAKPGPGAGGAGAAGNGPDVTGDGAGPGAAGEGAAGGAGDPEAAGQPGAPADEDAPGPVEVDAEGLAARVVAVPVAESRYSSLRTVSGGLAWLREPVTGVLGEGAAVPDEKPPRAALERFDLGHAEGHRAGLRAGLVRGQRGRRVAGGAGRRRAAGGPGAAQGGPGRRGHGPGGPVPGPVHRRPRSCSGGTPSPRRPGSCGTTSGSRTWPAWTGTRSPRPTGRCWTGSAAALDFADLLWEVVGELGTSHAYIRPPGHARRARPRAARTARRGPEPGRRRHLAGDPGAAGRVLRPAGPVPAGSPGRRGAARRCAAGRGRPPGGPAGRPGAAAGRQRREAGGADRGQRPRPGPPGGGRPAGQRAPAALPGLGRPATAGWSASCPAAGPGTCTSRT